MSKYEPTENPAQGVPLFTSGDLEILKEIRPKLSLGGGHFVDMIIKVFDTSEGQTSTNNLANLIQDFSGASGTSSLLYTLFSMMNGPSNPMS